MMEWNAESVLDALNDFERKPELSPILNEYLKRIAKNGEIIFPWSKLKPLLKKKLDVVLDEFYETCPVETSVPIPNFETFNFDSLKKTILQAVDSFTSAPFTIQRLCELVTDPTKHYNRTDKYMRGIEKNVLVVSTIEPRSANVGDGNNANMNPIVNGVLGDSPRDDNDTLNGHETTENVTSSNLNNPSNHVLLENFANVFPSAACIPSASNICINREIDSNFMSSSECDDTPRGSSEDASSEFESSSPVVQTDDNVAKEEDMDTTEDEPSNEANENNEAASNDAESPEDSGSPESEKPSESETIVKESESNSPAPENTDDVSASENVKHEADCSESHLETTTSNLVTTESSECQQDDTVSQSDDDSRNSAPVSQSDDAPDESDISQNDTAQEASTEVTQSITTSESSDQCMELESSPNSNEPPA